MPIRRPVPLVLFSSLALFASCASAPSPAAQLPGTWEPVKASLGGKELPNAFFQGGKLVLTATTYEFSGDEGTWSVVPGGPPLRMDIVGTKGPNQGRTMHSIFQIAGDDLTICYQLGPGERPQAFTTTEGTKEFLVHYRRAK